MRVTDLSSLTIIPHYTTSVGMMTVGGRNEEVAIRPSP